MLEKPAKGTIFGNLKVKELGPVTISFDDGFEKTITIDKLGTTVFEGLGDRRPVRVNVLGAEYRMSELPTSLEAPNRELLTLWGLEFDDGPNMILLCPPFGVTA